MAKQSTRPYRTLFCNGQQSTWPHRHYTATILTVGRTLYQASPFYSNEGRNKFPLNKYYVVPPNTNNVYTAHTLYRRQTHVRMLSNPATTPPHLRSRRQWRDPVGHRRSTMTLTISRNTPKNNSTSPNDVEFTNKRASNTSLNSQMRVASELHEVCRPLLPAELGTREPVEFLY